MHTKVLQEYHRLDGCGVRLVYGIVNNTGVTNLQITAVNSWHTTRSDTIIKSAYSENSILYTKGGNPRKCLLHYLRAVKALANNKSLKITPSQRRVL